jgi:uracil-DNA glycosylase family 4
VKKQRQGTPTSTLLSALNARVVACRRCPRLVAHREAVARRRKPQFATWEYWGRPVPGTGDARAHVLLVGLAPAAHGANRTGRMFTGDGSGDFLTRTLHAVGLASQPTSVHRDDGLRLRGTYLTAAARCVPPDNKPTPAELTACRAYLAEELRLLRDVRVIVALGQIAFNAMLTTAMQIGWRVPAPRPAFAHGARATLNAPGRPPIILLASYHPSRQNTQTGRLTAPMLTRVLRRAVTVARA